MARKGEILSLIGLLFIVGFFYLKILGGFFVQDEWYSFGWYIAHQNENLGFFFKPQSAHFNPLTDILTSRLFYLWGADYLKFAYLGIGLHLLVTLSVYFLAKTVFKKVAPAFVAALVFGVFASPYQGVSWVVVNIATLFSSLLGVISAILFFKNKIFWSLMALIISLLFKEITVGLFALYFLLLWPKKKKGVVLVVVFAVLYFVFRLLTISPIVSSTISPATKNVVYNFLTLSPKSLVQAILPTEFLKKVFITFAPHSQRIAYHYLLEVFSTILGLILFIFTLKMKKTTLFGALWVFLNSLVYSISPGAGIMHIIDSRNLYFTSVGAAVFLASLSKKFFFLTGVIILLNFYWLGKNLDSFSAVGEIRKNVLEKISTSYPSLPVKVVFYTESDSSYYGLSETEKIFPFQSGFGQTLLVYYNQTENFPKEFFPGDYLWEIRAQGYEEHEGRGFGYYRDLTLLKQALVKYNIPKESVIAFFWNGKENQLEDITAAVRNKL